MDAVIQFEGTIYEHGYGLIAQQVMRDTTLPKQAKLIYSYMCSFAGTSKSGERTAFPSVSLQCSELDMTEGTYYKWRKYLVDRGLIKITKQRQEKAKFDRNIYSIIAVPERKNPPQHSDELLKSTSDQQSSPYSKNSSTADSPYFNYPSMAEPSTVNQSTNSNSLNSNSFKRNTETRDTKETKKTSSALKNDFLKKGQNNIDHAKQVTIAKKNEEQEALLKESLRKNSGLSDRTFKLLSGFSESYEQMYNWIGIFYRAKKKAEENMNEVIVMEYEVNEELIYSSLLTVIRIIRTQEKRQPDNYMFMALKNALEEGLTIRSRQKMMNDDSNHWLNADSSN